MIACSVIWVGLQWGLVEYRESDWPRKDKRVGEVSGNRRGKRAPHETSECLTNAE